MVKEGNIVVDVGNSLIKSGKFVNDQLSERKVWGHLEEVRDYYRNHSGCDWAFSSVGYHYEDIKSLFDHLEPLLLTQSTPLPIKLNYHSPETLGVDRIASAVGAHGIYPNKNILVIDAGSCITYDVIDNEGSFQGGVIAPGLKMRMKAMHHFTKNLPDISDEWESLLLQSTGKTTRECLLNGSLSAVIHEMDGFIEHYLKEYQQLVVMMTGGDARYFESKLKPHIFADSNLVLKGLNRILNYNK